MNRVEVVTGSRLHFGLLCGPPDMTWHFGGIGLMIDSPSWHVSVSSVAERTDIIHGSGAAVSRINRIVSRFRSLHDLPSSLEIELKSEAPFHNGLGAGTQLTLAVATALHVLSGQSRPGSSAETAGEFERSRRSAIGTAGFDRGGFLVDYGRAENRVDRLPFPEEWRMVVVSVRQSEGLSGAPEEQFFGERSALSEASLQAADELIRGQILPSLQASQVNDVRAALGTYGDLVGEYYATAQGGIFSSQVIRDLISDLGPVAAVQSSWGPSIAMLTADQAEAVALKQRVLNHRHAEVLSAVIARGLNSGATVKTDAPPQLHDGQDRRRT